MVERYETRLAVVVPPGRRSSALRNAIAAAVHQAGFTPVGLSRLSDGLGAAGIVAAFDGIDARSAFRLGTFFESGLPVVAVVRDPANVPSGVEYTVYRSGHALPDDFIGKLHAVFATTASPG